LEGYDQVAYWQNAVKNWRNGESASR
jgi:hypothetical protein